MTRVEFMKELESLLYDIPSEEREEALQYYNGYFEEAGEDHEEDIIKELGTPERISSIIKADLNSNADERESRGYFTEKGYQDTLHNNEYEIIDPAKHNTQDNSSNTKYNSSNTQYNSSNTQYNKEQYDSSYDYKTGSYEQQGNTQNKQNQNSTNAVLIILLCIFTLPFTLPILGTAFGLVMGLLGILIGIGVAGICMMIAGIALFIAGFIQIGIPFLGLLLSGSGLVVFGIGMLFIFISVWLCKVILPAMIKGIVALCRIPFRNRSVTA